MTKVTFIYLYYLILALTIIYNINVVALNYKQNVLFIHTELTKVDKHASFHQNFNCNI